MSKPLFKSIQGFPGYYVSDRGEILTMKRPEYARFLFQEKHWHGHLKVKLCKRNTCKNFFVHRLVAEAFIPNPENKPLVNHIDGNKHNNCVENLEWATESENTQHYYRVIKPAAKAPVVEDTNFDEDIAEAFG